MSLGIGKRSHVERCLGNLVFPPGGGGSSREGRFVHVCFDIVSFPPTIVGLGSNTILIALIFLLVLPHLSPIGAPSLPPPTPNFSCEEKKAKAGQPSTTPWPRHETCFKHRQTGHENQLSRPARPTRHPPALGQALRPGPAIPCFLDALKHHPQLAVVNKKLR